MSEKWKRRKVDSDISTGFRAVSLEENKVNKNTILMGLMHFAIQVSTDDKTAKALADLDDLRLKVQDLLEILVPE